MKIQVLASPKGWHFLDLQSAAARFGPRVQLEAESFANLSTMLDGRQYSSNLDGDIVLARAMPGGSLEQVVFRMDALMSLVTAGTRVVNSPKAIEAAVDKFLTLVRLQAAGLPIPQTCVSQETASALQHFGQLGGRVIVKPIFGSLGREIYRIDSENRAIDYFRKCESMERVIYQQRIVDHGGTDYRLLAVGQQVWGMRRTGQPLVTNIRQGGIGHSHRPTAIERELAIRACQCLGAEIAGVDLAYDRDSGEPVILEVNSSPGWKALSQVCKVDIASEIIDYLVR